MRSVDLLEEAGWLSPRTWVAHGIHFNASEIERLGKAGVSVCHCAASDMAFGMGVCPTKELEAAGVAIGLGVDGSASNDSSNMMEAVRHSLMLQRLSYGPSAVTPYDALRWATQGSAHCLGRDDIGAIAPGMQADLALFTLDEPRFSGAQDPIAALAALRRPSGGPGDGRGPMAGHRREPRGRRSPRPDRQAQSGRARLRLTKSLKRRPARDESALHIQRRREDDGQVLPAVPARGRARLALQHRPRA